MGQVHRRMPSGASSASKVEGGHQESHPLALGQRGRRRVLKKMCPSTLLFLEKVTTDPCPSGTCPKISYLISFVYGPGTSQAVAYGLDLGEGSLCRSRLRVESVSSATVTFLLRVGPAPQVGSWLDLIPALPIHLSGAFSLYI